MQPYEAEILLKIIDSSPLTEDEERILDDDIVPMLETIAESETE